MATTAHKLGPGQLTFGETGTKSEWGAQCNKVEITPDFKEGDTIDLLDGSTYAEEDTATWKISGTVLESYDAASLILWAKDNQGKSLPFIFRPRNDATLSAKGTVQIRAIGMGGDVKKVNQRDFEFKVIGEPDFTTDAPAG